MKKVILGISMMLAAFGMTAVARTTAGNNNCNSSACCNQQKVCDETRQCADKAVCPEARQCSDKAVCHGDSSTAPCRKNKAPRHGKKCRRQENLCGDSTCRNNCKQSCSASNRKREHRHHSDRRHADGMNEKLTTTLFNDISLSAEQQTRIVTLKQEMTTKRDKAHIEMKKKTAEAKEAEAKAYQKAKADYEKGVKKVLTAEQYAQYELNQKEMEARMSARSEARKAKAEARKAKSEARKAKSEARELKAEMSRATTTNN